MNPAELENEITSADFLVRDSDPDPGAEGEDQGVGTEDDYNNGSNEYIGPESTPVKDDDNKTPPKKDTATKTPIKKEDNNDNKPIGSPTQEPEKKKGLLKKIFGKKDKQN